MIVYVMSAERRNGVSKKTNTAYDSVVADCVYVVGGKLLVKQLWINPELLPEGEFPQYGDVLDVQVDFGGFIQSVKFLDTKFALNEHKKQ